MRRHWISAGLLGLMLMAVATRAATPKEAIGFWGTVTGTVKSASHDGLSLTLAVLKAEPDDSKSKIKDGGPMVGKVLTLGVHMPRKDGKPSPAPEDVAWIKTLKPGDTVKVKIFSLVADQTVQRIQGPGEAVASDEKPKSETPKK